MALICVRSDYNFIETFIFSFASAVGYGTALILFAGLRERFEIAHIPRIFKGTAIALVTAGLMALAFFGFQGMV